LLVLWLGGNQPDFSKLQDTGLQLIVQISFFFETGSQNRDSHSNLKGLSGGLERRLRKHIINGGVQEKHGASSGMSDEKQYVTL